MNCILTVEEKAIVAMYAVAGRTETAIAMVHAFSFMEDSPEAELVASALQKLIAMDDREFAALDLTDILRDDAGEEA